MIEQGGTKKVDLSTSDTVLGQVKITDGTDVADVIDRGTYSGVASVILDSLGDPANPATADKQDEQTLILEDIRSLETLANDYLTEIVQLVGIPQGIIPSSPTAFSVGITSSVILNTLSNRSLVILTNTSTNDISISFDSAAVLYSGITLFPRQAIIIDNRFSASEIRAIASGASSNLACQIGTS